MPPCCRYALCILFAIAPSAGGESTIEQLRRAGNYTAALAEAREELTRLEAGPTARPWELRTARRLVATLEHIAQLPADARKDLAYADSLTVSLDRYAAAGEYAPATELAKRQLHIRTRYLGARHPEVGESHNDLARFLDHQGMSEEAADHHVQALDIYREVYGPEHPLIANSLNNLGAVMLNRGDQARAEVLWKEALAMRRRILDRAHSQTAGSLSNLAALYMQQGEFARALPICQEAVDMRLALTGEDHPLMVPPLANLALLHMEQGDPALAEQLLRRVIEIQRRHRGETHPDLGLTFGDLAHACFAQHRNEEAEAYFREAIDMWRRTLGPQSPELALALRSLGRFYLEGNDLERAEPLLRESLEMTRRYRGQTHRSVVATQALLARCLARRGGLSAAESLLVEAAEGFETARLQAGFGYARTLFSDTPHLPLAVVRLLLGREADAWQAVERASARTLADLLMTSELRPMSLEEVSREDSLRRRLTRLEGQLTHLPPGTSREEIEAELLSAEASWCEFQRRIALRYPIRKGLTYPRERIQKTLSDRAAIVGWLEADQAGLGNGAWGFVLRSSGPVHWVSLPSARSTEDYRRALVLGGAWPFRVSRTDRLDASARDLGKAWLDPLLPHLEGIDHLIVIPTGSILGLPLESLADAGGMPYLDRFTISYTPSATIHTWLRERDASKPTPSERRTLLLGDPVFPGQSRLPGARREVEEVSSIFPHATLLLDSDASEQRWIELARTHRLESFDTIHLATHAVVDDERPDRSALLLATDRLPDALEASLAGTRLYDGRLTAREIVSDCRLDANLVVLSGCRTGLGRAVPREGHIGLAHAFLQAGARSLIVSLWPADDEASALLMGRFYRNLMEAPKAEALREAKRWLRDRIDAEGGQPYRHPAYWAGFILVGLSDT